MIASSSKDMQAKVFDAQTMEEIACFHTDRGLNGVAFSPLFNQVILAGGLEARDVTTSRSGKMEVKSS